MLHNPPFLSIKQITSEIWSCISCLAEQQKTSTFLVLCSTVCISVIKIVSRGLLGFHTTFTYCTTCSTPDGKPLPEHNQTRTIIRFKKCSATRGLSYVGSTMEIFYLGVKSVKKVWHVSRWPTLRPYVVTH